MSILTVTWGLLNMSLLISFLIGLFTGFRSLRERFGSLGSILPLMLLVVMCQSQSTNQRLQNDVKLDKFNTIAVQPYLPADAFRHPYFSVINDQTTFDIQQSIFLNQIHQSDSIQISCKSYLVGFVSGIVWIPIDTQVNFQSNKQVQYNTLGNLEWQLLGVPIFKQRKQVEGHVNLSEPGF